LDWRNVPRKRHSPCLILGALSVTPVSMKFWRPSLRERTSSSVNSLSIDRASVPSHTPLAGGHTNTERGYLPILASNLKKVASDGPDNFTEEEKRLLSQMVVHVSKEDRHPLVLA
jgi:hypothetical protein